MIYASKTPRDLNHDPQPFVGADGSRKSRYSRFAPREDRRPEFDHVQHNEPNPLLVDMREFWPVIVEDWLAALDDPWFMDGVPEELGVATEDHREHAKKVLTRLAELS